MWKIQVQGTYYCPVIWIGPFIISGGSWKTRRLIENAHLEAPWKISQSPWGKVYTSLSHLHRKEEMEETKPGMKGQGFNIYKCFYISWYKTHDSEWLPKCLNPIRHSKKKKKKEWSEHHLFVLLVHVVMVTYLTTCGYGNAFEIMKDPLLYYNDNYQWHL